MHLLMTAPCLLGLEGLVADELRFMEAENVLAENLRQKHLKNFFRL